MSIDTLIVMTDAQGFITLHEPDEDGRAGDMVASVWRDDWLKRLTTPMTPEPAQPAESPEARALIAELRNPWEGLSNGLGLKRGEAPQWACDLMQRAANALAATTARPTERGAVEGGDDLRWSPQGVLAEMLVVATATVEEDEQTIDDWPLDCRADVDRWQSVLSRALAKPATDQAGEVGRLRAVIEQAANHLDIGVHRSSIIAGDLRAALDTQPATGQQPELPMDVRRLVVAARRALDANDWASTGKRDRMRTLDKAVEAFSSRVDYDDQPATGRTDQVADAGKPIATGRTMGGEVEAADIAEIHEIVTAWRSSIGNPATWLQVPGAVDEPKLIGALMGPDNAYARGYEAGRRDMREAAGWQPIETAPDDGRYFLAYAPRYGVLLMRKWSATSTETFALSGPSWKQPEPSHWMPLPTEPLGGEG